VVVVGTAVVVVELAGTEVVLKLGIVVLVVLEVLVVVDAAVVLVVDEVVVGWAPAVPAAPSKAPEVEIPTGEAANAVSAAAEPSEMVTRSFRACTSPIVVLAGPPVNYPRGPSPGATWMYWRAAPGRRCGASGG